MLESKSKRFSDNLQSNPNNGFSKDTIPSGTVDMLQRSIGNAAVGRLIQRQMHNRSNSSGNMLIQRQRGDKGLGKIMIDSAQTGKQDEFDLDEYSNRQIIKQLHGYTQFEIAEDEKESEIIQDENYVSFIEGDKAETGLPTATKIEELGFYGNKKDPENEGKYEGKLKRYGEGFKIVPKNSGWDNFEKFRTPNGNYDYAVLGDIQDGEVFVSTKGHYSMTGGKSILYAGEVSFKDGSVTKWNNKSGHYEPHSKDAPRAPFPIDLYGNWEKGNKQEKQEKEVSSKDLLEQQIEFLRSFWEGKTYENERLACKAIQDTESELFKDKGFRKIKVFANENKVKIPVG